MALKLHVFDTLAKPETYLDGTISFPTQPNTILDLGDLSVRLIGTSNTRVILGEGPNQERYESIHKFLELKEEVHRGPLGVGAGCVFHFFIRLPEDPASAQLAPQSTQLLRMLGKPEPQSLPPSGELGQGTVIAYKVEVVLEDKDLQQEIKAETMINFSTTRAIKTPDPETITLNKEISCDNIASTSQPPNIRITLETPRVVVQEEAFPLVLRFAHHRRSTNTMSSLGVYVLSCVAQLHVKTAVRCGEDARDTWTKTDFVPLIDDDFGGLQSLQPTIPDRDQCWEIFHFETSISTCYPPSFQTTNISRFYDLEICMSAQYEEETFDLRFEVVPLTVLAAEYVANERARTLEPGYDESKIYRAGKWHIGDGNYVYI